MDLLAITVRDRPNLYIPSSKHIITGADPGFQARWGALKKIAPSGGSAKNFGVFRVKNHDFTPKKSYFNQLRREARTFLGYFV